MKRTALQTIVSKSFESSRTRNFSLTFTQATSCPANSSSENHTNQQQQDKCPYHHHQHQKYTTFNELPGPKGLPLIGNLLDFIKNSKAPHEFLSNLIEKDKTVALTAMRTKLIATRDPELMSEIAKLDEGRTTLIAARKFKLDRGWPQAPVECFNEDNWQEIRQLFNIAMKPEFAQNIIIPQLTELNSEFLQYLIKHLKYCGDGNGRYELTEGMKVVNRYTFNSVVKTFLGAKITDEVAKEKLSFSVDDYVHQVVSFLDILLGLNNGTQLYRIFKTKEYKQMEEGYELSINRSKEVIRVFENCNNNGKPRLMELLVERASKLENGKTDDYVVSVLGSFLMGGVDITARTIAILMYRMASQPEWQDRLYEETVQVFGKPTLDEITSENGLEISHDQYKQLKICKNFIDESMRLNHVSRSTSTRVISKDIEACGLKIEKGTNVIFVEDPLRNGEFVSKSTEFIPERWEKGSDLTPPRGFPGPFGRGARKCPGERVASIEIVVALVNIIRHFNLSQSTGNTMPPLVETQFLGYIDMNKHKLYFHPREHLAQYLKNTVQ